MGTSLFEDCWYHWTNLMNFPIKFKVCHNTRSKVGAATKSSPVTSTYKTDLILGSYCPKLKLKVPIDKVSIANIA
uniref:Uncharacterized protein n=1 Tax=Solanum tuberosum TaxID=4113 RepID=M1AC70_SOLTU